MRSMKRLCHLSFVTPRATAAIPLTSLRWAFVLRAVAILFLFPITLLSADWPNWRGPNTDGTTSEKDFPISWDRTNNVLWRVELPERGNSSPIVWKDRVFITQAISNGGNGRAATVGQRTVICLDRKTGKTLWQSGPTYNEPELTMEDSNPYCAASPVTDGDRVIAHFGSAGLYCFDFKGRELWHADLGKISHRFGTASSPCLSGDLCFVYVGPGEEKQEMVAVNKRTGKIAWRSPALLPTTADLAKLGTNSPPYGSWATPSVIDNHGRKEVIMPFNFRIGSYDFKNGNLLWETNGLGLQIYVTPLWTDGLLLVMGGSTTYALRPSISSKTPELAWKQERGKFRFGSGVATDNHLFYLAENGLAECWEKSTGKILWQERLQGTGKKNTTWSSLSMAGQNIFAPNQSGDVFIFLANPDRFQILSTNSIAEPTNASLALSQNCVFMRTDQSLWCFGNKS
jgi:outer membrane protein assembly factor BamB